MSKNRRNEIINFLLTMYEVNMKKNDDQIKVWLGSHKSDGSFYIVTSLPSEDRGGTCKPAAVYCTNDLKEALARVDNNYHKDIYWVKDGVMYEFDRNIWNDFQTKDNSRARLVFEEEINPDTIAWWTRISGMDGSEEEENYDYRDPGYLVVMRIFDYSTGELTSKNIGYLKSAKTAWTVYSGAAYGECSDENVVDLFRIDGGEAKLIMTTAPITNPSSIETTGFTQYDRAVGSGTCGFCCKFCYGCETKDIKELTHQNWDRQPNGSRVVIGTHHDPYSPGDHMNYYTNESLKKLKDDKSVTKVGIFTRSPMVERDLDLIKQLPNPTIHFTLSPYSEEWRQILELNTPSNEDRVQSIMRIVEAGVRVVLNISPCIPGISEGEGGIDNPLLRLAYTATDEICIGLMCMYGQIPEKMGSIMPKETVNRMMKRDWEIEFRNHCKEVFADFMVPGRLVIWRDRTRLGWLNLATDSRLPQEYYRA